MSRMNCAKRAHASGSSLRSFFRPVFAMAQSKSKRKAEARAKKAKARAKSKDSKTANPWDIPTPLPTIGETLTDAIHTATGKALTSWEYLEEALAHLFALILGVGADPETEPAIRAYGSVISFKSRADMVRAAADVFFRLHPSETLQPEFIALLTACIGWSGRRNDVAHGKVTNLAPLFPQGVFLVPGYYNNKRQQLGKGPSYRYTAQEIRKFEEGFVDLYDKLSDFTTRLRDAPRMPPQEST